MNLTLFFGLLGGLLVLAFAANLLARRTGIPDVLVLMATGVLLGPLLHLFDPAKFAGVTRGFGTLALILILFEAGLELDLRQVLRHFPAGFLLALVSYALSMALVAVAAHFTMGLSLASALIVAAVLGGVSASVSLPVLQNLKLRTNLRTMLVVEGAMADILSVLAVSALLNAPAGSARLSTFLGGFATEFGISLALGLLAGIGWSFLLPRLSDQRFWQVLTFGAVLVLYATTAVAGGGALLAVLIFGLTLTNVPVARHHLAIADPEPETTPLPPHTGLLAFHAELSFLVRTFFFVLIGVMVKFSGFWREWLPVLAIFAAILLARWLSVLAVRLIWRKSHAHERELAFWMHPRGLITVVLALEAVSVSGPSWRFLEKLAFAVLVLTSLTITIGTLRGKRLGKLLEEGPDATNEAGPV